MPSVEELLEKSTKKKFVKKDRRPWDYDTAANDGDDKDQLKEILPSKISQHDSKLKETTALVKKTEQKQEDKKVTQKVTEKVTQEDRLSVKPLLIEKTVEPVENSSPIDYGLDIARTVLTKREIQNLVGVQKKLFFTIFNTCVKEGALSTITFSTKDLEEKTQSSCGTVKTSLNRLFKKALLIRLDGKRAKGGYLYIGFNKEVWDICMQMVNEDKSLVK